MTLTLVVSDLHISSGCNPDTGKYSPLDDFHADHIFARFLAHYEHEADAHLVFNGDTFDPTQVIDLPPAEELPQIIGSSHLDRDRRKYGLGSSGPEISWKLSRIALGHRRFFQALGSWVQRQHHIHFVIGNHDVELRHPVAQERLVHLIAQAHPDLTPATAQPLIHFHDWYLLQPEQQLYIEHGGQYEPLAYTDDSRHPACYFNNRYLFNLLEVRTPEADNIYPFSRYIGWLASTDTLPTLAILLRQLPDFLRARRQAHGTLPPTTPPAIRLAPHVEEQIRQIATEQHNRIEHIGSRTSLFTVTAILLNLASHLCPLATVILAVTGRVIPAILVLVTWPLSHLISNAIINTHLHGSLLRETNFLQEVARRIAPALAEHQVRTITFGHTHQADLAHLPGEMQYLNTGTWVPIFSDDTRLDAREQAYYFIQVRNGEASLNRWNDTKGEPESPIIIDRTRRAPRRSAQPSAARKR